MSIPFRPWAHTHLYLTEEYKVYLATLAGQASDEALHSMIGLLTDPTIAIVARVELDRRHALDK